MRGSERTDPKKKGDSIMTTLKGARLQAPFISFHSQVADFLEPEKKVTERMRDRWSESVSE